MFEVPEVGVAGAPACPEAPSPSVEGDAAAGPVFAPPAGLASGPLGAVQAADREIARQIALRARALAAFAVTCPAAVDRAQGEPGAMSAERWAARPELLKPVSEWAAQEVSIALSATQGWAEDLLERSLTLVHRLPGVLAALEAGALTEGQLWSLLDLLAPIADDQTRAALEADVLRWLAERATKHMVTTPPQLRARLRRELLKRGAREAADRAAKALRQRGVYRQAEKTPGLAGVAAVMSEPEAQAFYAALEAYADAVEDEPDALPRSRAQKMLDCLLDLVLRPGEWERPPVQVMLTLVAG